MQLLDGVNGGWTRGEVTGFLFAKRIKDSEWVGWLRRFGEGLLATNFDPPSPPLEKGVDEADAGSASPTENSWVTSVRELALRMVQLGRLYDGELGKVAGEIGGQLLELIPPPPPLPDEDDSDIIWNGQVIEAEFVGNGLTSPEPQDAEALFNKGYEQGMRGDFEGSIASYDLALTIKPDNDDAWNNRGISLSLLGRYEKAIASYDRALTINPDNHSACFNRGLSLDNLGRHVEAIASYDRALTIKPDYHSAWINRGVSLANLGRHVEAIASYDRALKINPDLHQAWGDRGVSLNNLGRHEEAFDSYDRALTIKPDYHEAWLNRGLAAGSVDSKNPLTPFIPSVFVIQNPDLDKRGYEGKLASFEEGLKHCPPDTHPEGGGELHYRIGDAKYFRGRRDDRRRNYYWSEAVKSYHTALETLTETAFPERHLEVVQSLIRVLAGLGETETAEKWQLHGLQVLQDLLNRSTSPYVKQKQAEKFWSLRQLGVDLLVQKGLLAKAIEAVELSKNLYLTWILDAYREDTLSPSWSQMRQLLHHSEGDAMNPVSTRAIIYWHVSPGAITTFILKPDTSEPILLRHLGETAFLSSLIEFENWVEDWQKQYQDYRDKAKTNESRNSHNWVVQMPERLRRLRDILDIPAIESQLAGISQLILIPHRELHLLPLEALFDSYAVTRLPSAQIGITLATDSATAATRLLSVEHPDIEELGKLPFAEIESAAICLLFDNHTRLAVEKATKKDVAAALENNYSIFHFTGHAQHDAKAPKQSALYLSATDKLTQEEICRLKLEGYRLVTLSACETGIAKNQLFIEYVGLMSAFVSRRVYNVVSTLWTVQDRASCLLMIYFYCQLKKGKSPTVALAKARKWLRELTDGKLEKLYKVIFAKLPPNEKPIRPFVRTELYRIGMIELSQKKQKLFDHPHFWAAFTITGVGDRL